MEGGKMRTEQEMIDIILDIANSDERIRGVMLGGSRADSSIPKDQYQDYDIGFAVTDMKPFYNNPAWVTEKFGKPLIMQMPETLRGAVNDGNFFYLMLFSDGVRIDLSFIFDEAYIDDGEPVIVLLDKDNGKGFFPPITINEKYWSIKLPTALDYRSACNNFWWCLNNVAKGIMRDELPFVMASINNDVRSNLHEMINWHIGIQHGFDVSTGKNGRFFKKYLSVELYARYADTYSGSNYSDIWSAVFVMCDLFHDMALTVAKHFDFSYQQNEEDGIREYLKMTKAAQPLISIIQNNPISYQPFNTSHTNGVLKLSQEWFRENITFGIIPDTAEDIASYKNEYFHVALNGEDVVGYITAEIINGNEYNLFPRGASYLRVNDLYIAKEYRSRGIGEKLLSIVEKKADENKVQHIYVSSATKDADAVRRFYQRNEYGIWTTIFYKRRDWDVRTYPFGELGGYPYVVIFARYQDKWLYCRAKERDTFETAGGHIEDGETPLEAAKRELFEETGAIRFDIKPAFDYSVHTPDNFSNGQVFLVHIHELGNIPEDTNDKMVEVKLFDTIPDKMRFPQILPILFEKYQITRKMK